MMFGHLKRCGNSGEILNFSLARFGVQSFHIPLFTLFQRGAYENFQEISQLIRRKGHPGEDHLLRPQRGHPPQQFAGKDVYKRQGLGLAQGVAGLDLVRLADGADVAATDLLGLLS